MDKDVEHPIKEASKRRGPAYFRYTKENLTLLLEMVDNISGDNIIKNGRTYSTILVNLTKAIYDHSAHEAFEFLYGKKWGKATKYAYNLMYETPLEEVPLYLNKPYTTVIAKWRLLINK